MDRKATVQTQWNNLRIDERNAGKLRKEIAALAASYVPEWHFDPERPDAGSAIAMVFADQTAENITRYNQVLDKYHTQFVNMLDVSLRPAKPASATILMRPIQDDSEGIDVPKGTQFMAEATEDGEPVIFETRHNLHVTAARIVSGFQTSATGNHVSPVVGDVTYPAILEESSEEEDLYEIDEEEKEKMKPFLLFGAKEASEVTNALLLYHPSVFDVENGDIRVRLTGSEKLLEGISSGKYVFRYAGENGLEDFDSVRISSDKEMVVLSKSGTCKRVSVGGEELFLLVLETGEDVEENVKIGSVSFASTGKAEPVQFAGSGVTDFDVNSFHVFGDTLSLYQECYIGHNDYFQMAGSQVKLTFDVSYPEHPVMLTPVEVKDDLKIIKRKPRAVVEDVPADAFAEEISIEYFNGIGWKKLPCKGEMREMFANPKAGKLEIAFMCPSDWQETAAGAYQGRCIRIQLLKSDNCYMRPCIHHYPHMENLKVSFTYENAYLPPVAAKRISGTKEEDLTEAIVRGEEFVAFSQGDYVEDALYLGLNRRLEAGPVSLLFLLEDNKRYEGLPVRFEYSTGNGFKQMKVLDYTADLSHSGIVLFMPPTDFHKETIEGNRCYWIRMTHTGKDIRAFTRPVIKDIRLNAAVVENVESLPVEDFFIDEIRTDLHFSLSAKNILDAEVWVNEYGLYTEKGMKQELAEHPERTYAEYDYVGDITAFYTLWTEADILDGSAGKKSYLLDRMNNELIFGDGIQTEVPRVMNDTAVRVKLRTCDGSRGNVEPGSINTAVSSQLFLNEIENPVKAYGGNDIETIDSALERGSNILRSRRRLVSISDYEREILSYSDNVASVRTVVGKCVDGTEDPKALSFVVLLKDHENGSFSFHSISNEMKRHLSEGCELTVSPEDLRIVEPIFVDISVDTWVESVDLDDSFAVQNLMQDQLKEYLHPVDSEHGRGWPIGTLPKRSQLYMKLGALGSRAIVKKMVVTGRYTDETGEHEMDLEEIKESPFMVCRSGKHKVHILLSDTH